MSAIHVFSPLISLLAKEHYWQEFQPEEGNEMEIVNKRGKQFKEADPSKNCDFLHPTLAESKTKLFVSFQIN